MSGETGLIGSSRDGHVLLIELRREERRNALNTQLCTELREAVEAAPADGVRVVVITGQGTSFCAGADLSGDEIPAEFPAALIGLMKSLETVEIPVIAAVNGPAVGAGTQLALASDLRVVSPDAFFAIPSTRLGIAVDNWTVKRFAALAGGGASRTVLMGGEKLDADGARLCGLANKVGTLDDALEWAHRITELAPLSLRHLKLVFNDDGTRDDPNPAQQAAYEAAWSSADVVEARNARIEKRKPNFRGE